MGQDRGITLHTNGSGYTPEAIKHGLKEPVKFIIELIFFFIAFIPLTIYSIYKHVTTIPKSVKGKTIIITGAGGGLGRELCLRFARNGANIAACDIADNACEETASLVKKTFNNVSIKSYHCDVTSTKEIHELHKAVNKDFGLIDIIINNAGWVKGSTLQDTDDKYFDTMIGVNLKSNYKMANEFLPEMKKRNEGHIVSIASLSSFCSVVNLNLYAASKHAVFGFMEGLQDELDDIAGNRIKTTTICPYFIRTNNEYTIEWDLRMHELPVSFVAKQVVSAVLKNRRIVSIPNGFFSMLQITRLFPHIVRIVARKILYIKVNPVLSTRH